MAKAKGFGRVEKLKSRKLIESLFASRSSLQVFPLRVKYRFMPAISGKAGLQMGVTVGKTHFKKAVDRNRIKRLVREAWRLQKAVLMSQLKESGTSGFVFFIYTAKEIVSFATVSEAMEKCIRQLQQKARHEKTA